MPAGLEELIDCQIDAHDIPIARDRADAIGQLQLQIEEAYRAEQQEFDAWFSRQEPDVIAEAGRLP